MTDGNGGPLPKKNRGLIIAVGGGLVLAFLYLLTRGTAGGEVTASGDAVGWQSIYSRLSQALADGLQTLRTDVETRFGMTEEAIEAQAKMSEEQAEAIAALEEQTGIWQGVIDALVEQFAGVAERLGELEESQAGLGASLAETVQAQMLNTAKSLFLSLEGGSQNRSRLNFLRNYVIKRLREWGYPEDVIDQFKAWVNPHIEESVTGKKQTGGAVAFLEPFYGTIAPLLDPQFDRSIDAPGLPDLPLRGRYGLH